MDGMTASEDFADDRVVVVPNEKHISARTAPHMSKATTFNG